MSQTQSKPLISVLVACYNNQKYIFDTLRSIFDQTYPNIEILIGDDASETFHAESIINWVNKYKTANIKKVAIFENEINLGTVANFEKLQRKSSGDFLFHIAADDTFHGPTVLEDAYELAEQIGPQAEMIAGQTELWDITLTKKLGDWITPEMENFIKNSTPEEIFAECSARVILPASYLYRRSMLEKVGKLSDQYRLVEDWPTHLRVTRQGVRPYFLDGIPLIKHRDGGISHGNSLHSQKIFLTYYEDILKLYPYEVQPYESTMSDEARERVQKYYRDRLRAYYTIHLKNYQNAIQAPGKQDCTANHSRQKKTEQPLQREVTKKYQNKMRLLKAKKLLKDKMYRYSRKKVILFTFCCFVFFGITSITIGAMNSSMMQRFSGILNVVSGCIGFALAGEIASNILLRIRKAMWERRQ